MAMKKEIQKKSRAAVNLKKMGNAVARGAYEAGNKYYSARPDYAEMQHKALKTTAHASSVAKKVADSVARPVKAQGGHIRELNARLLSEGDRTVKQPIQKKAAAKKAVTASNNTTAPKKERGAVKRVKK